MKICLICLILVQTIKKAKNQCNQHNHFNPGPENPLILQISCSNDFG